MERFQRWQQRLREGLHELLAPAADPRAATDVVYYQELLAGIRRTRQELTQTRQELQARLPLIEQRLLQLEQQAGQALLDSGEDMARQLLRQRQRTAADLAALQQQVSGFAEQEHKLELREQELVAQLEALASRLSAVSAHYSAAEAQLRVSRAFEAMGSDLDELRHMIGQLEQRGVELHSRAVTIDELARLSQTRNGALEQRLNQLVQEQDVEAALLMLKRQLSDSNEPAGGS